MHRKLGKQDALKIAINLDQTDYDWALPGKFKMAVSGCHLRCPEFWVRDIGPIGQKNRRDLAADGNVRKLIDSVADSGGLNEVEALAASERGSNRPSGHLQKDGIKAMAMLSYLKKALYRKKQELPEFMDQ
jgi:sulfite reductase beta subunit-like hemoprotein